MVNIEKKFPQLKEDRDDEKERKTHEAFKNSSRSLPEPGLEPNPEFAVNANAPEMKKKLA